MTRRDLSSLAEDLGLDPRAHADSGSLLSALLASPGIEAAVDAVERLRLEGRLNRLRAGPLRDLGRRHGVPVEGRTKAEIVSELLAAPASRILIGGDARGGRGKGAERPAGATVHEDIERLRSLLETARTRFEDRKILSSIETVREAIRLAERAPEPLRRACWSYALLGARSLLEPCDPEDPEVGAAWDLFGEVRDLYDSGRRSQDAILERLLARSLASYEGAASRLRDELSRVRDAIREAANVGASIAVAEDAWRRAGDRLDRGDLREARDELGAASRSSEEARARLVRDVEDALLSAEDHISLARNVGANVDEAVSVLGQARAAVLDSDYFRAGDFVKRAERLAMQGQQLQIGRAMEIRQSQLDRASAIIAGAEPLVIEGESYGINVTEARVLLRQARDVLARGDYVAGFTFARNAEEAAHRLLPSIEDERRRRGILKPSKGICGACGSDRLHYFDDGWGRCLDCRGTFRWRAPLGIVERVRGLLGT
ncbi:MAG: hypothetical protein A3K68_04920 [Euryarchaeota archaeon RBG_16_68_13]|nr:MAG: hypothetical protein A3K68_04920 [Euryarchaeota archaeon RBG_16_68_13]